MLVYQCKACGAAIVFVKTTAGKRMPCDAGRVPYAADPAGKDTIITQNGETLRGTISPARKELTGLGYRPHWANCPGSGKFKVARK